MLTFFRKIRKSLFISNGIQKYTLYAIGEIALVVIGILIALQINNWNEWRKDRAKEVVLLEGLADNLNKNIIELEGSLDNHALGVESADYVISVLDGSVEYSDSVDQVLNWAIYSNNLGRLSTVGFDALKNSGFDLILNRTLRDGIQTLFDDTYRKMYGRFEWGYTETWEDYLDKHFIAYGMEDRAPSWRPFNFINQMNDPYFLSNISKIRLQRIFYKDALFKSVSQKPKGYYNSSRKNCTGLTNCAYASYDLLHNSWLMPLQSSFRVRKHKRIRTFLTFQLRYNLCPSILFCKKFYSL